VADSILKRRFLAVEAGGQVVRTSIRQAIPMGGDDLLLELEVNRLLLFRNGT
jgi:hypothetical protein